MVTLTPALRGGGRMKRRLTFQDGYICAVAEIIRTHDLPTVAKDVLKGLGKVDWSKIEPEDRELLQKHGLAL